MHYFNLTWFSKMHLRVIKRIINKSLVQYFSSQKLFLCPSLFQFQPQTTKLFKVMCFVLKPTKLIFYLKTSIICLHGSSCCEFNWVMQVLWIGVTSNISWHIPSQEKLSNMNLIMVGFFIFPFLSFLFHIFHHLLLIIAIHFKTHKLLSTYII